LREKCSTFTVLPNGVLRARSNVPHEGQPLKHLVALSSSQFDPKPP
jgi:hypothetical protein